MIECSLVQYQCNIEYECHMGRVYILPITKQKKKKKKNGRSRKEKKRKADIPLENFTFKIQTTNCPITIGQLVRDMGV